MSVYNIYQEIDHKSALLSRILPSEHEDPAQLFREVMGPMEIPLSAGLIGFQLDEVTLSREQRILAVQMAVYNIMYEFYGSGDWEGVYQGALTWHNIKYQGCVEDYSSLPTSIVCQDPNFIFLYADSGEGFPSFDGLFVDMIIDGENTRDTIDMNNLNISDILAMQRNALLERARAGEVIEPDMLKDIGIPGMYISQSREAYALMQIVINIENFGELYIGEGGVGLPVDIELRIRQAVESEYQRQEDIYEQLGFRPEDLRPEDLP